MKKLNIIYVANLNEVLNRKSALGSYIFCLANILGTDYDVYINNQKVSKLNQNSISHVSLSNPKSFVSKYIPGIIKKIIKTKKRLTLYKENKEKLLEENTSHYNVILEFYTIGSSVGFEMAKIHNAKFVLVYDSPVLEEYEFFHGKCLPSFRNFVLNQQKKSFSGANKVICYSNPVKDYINTIVNYPKKNVFIHQNIDFSRFLFRDIKKTTGCINLCFIGSFLKWHRVDMLLQAFAKITEYNNLKLYLIGEGQEWEISKQLANKLHLNDKVIFTGYKDGNELEQLKAIMHIGIMPGSNWYGAPNKIFEYGATGLAVIAPSTPTVTDIFSDSAGIVYFENNNSKDFQNKLEWLIFQLQNGDTNNASTLQNFIRETYNSKNTLKFYSDVLN